MDSNERAPSQLETAALRLGVVVLAAGLGSRFSSRPGEKLTAPLDGAPVLGHVIEAVREYGPATTVVVLGHAADRIEQEIPWLDEVRVRNQTPQQGIASSLRVGLDALAEAAPDVDGAFVVLGDQPRLRSATLAHLATAATEASATARPLIVPRYEDGPGPRNPVLIRRSAWPLVGEMDGDHGLAPLIAVHPELVWDVPVAGVMPDVDRPEDLERLRLSGDRRGPGPAARAGAYPSSPG